MILSHWLGKVYAAQKKRIVTLEAKVAELQALNDHLNHENAALAQLHSQCVDARDVAEDEVAELDTLFNLQQQRMQETGVDKKWQEATGNPGVMPDLGTLLVWLDSRAEKAEEQIQILQGFYNSATDRADAAEARVAQLEISVGEWATEARQMKSERDALRKTGQSLEISLMTILDNIDYVQGNCRPNEMVGAVLPKEVIALARASLKGNTP